MFGLNFQDSYQVVHVNMNNEWEDYDSRKYPGNDDILLLHKNESYKIAEMDFDILVIQFYEFAYLLTEEILRSKRIGYVALEAMQYGVPVISSNNGGLNEILSGYKYKYNPYEPMALEHMIQVFQQDSNEEVREQQEILQENLKRFTIENMAGEYNRIWDELLQK